jgi:hypothetical protein
MRSRFFGASSYDDEDDDEEMDLSGFVTSSETQPVVVERKRAPKADTGATEASNMGNAGAKTYSAPPPPMGNMGFYAKGELAGENSPSNFITNFNPLYAHDNLSPKMKTAVIGSKMTGLAVAGTGALTGLMTSYKTAGKAMFVAGSAAYVHPVLGFKRGALMEVSKAPDARFFLPLGSGLIQLSGMLAFYQLFARTVGPVPELQNTKLKIAGFAGVGAAIIGGLRLMNR